MYCELGFTSHHILSDPQSAVVLRHDEWVCVTPPEGAETLYRKSLNITHPQLHYAKYITFLFPPLFHQVSLSTEFNNTFRVLTAYFCLCSQWRCSACILFGLIIMITIKKNVYTYIYEIKQKFSCCQMTTSHLLFCWVSMSGKKCDKMGDGDSCDSFRWRWRSIFSPHKNRKGCRCFLFLL